MNEVEVRRTFEVLKQNNELVEVRIISGKATFSGYFRDVDNLIKQLKPFENARSANIYFVLNKIKASCYDREQCEQFIQNPKTTTTDNDIEARDWLLIDIDPVRSSGVSSSDEEKEGARKIALAVYQYLKGVGFSKPISCDSGNGWHLLYSIGLENTEENKELVKSVLYALDLMFSDEVATIDTSVFNASRITKLYGTIAKKGNNSKTRPHRESKILKVPDVIVPTKKAVLQRVANAIPKPETPSYHNNYGKTQFDIDDFLSRHHIGVKKIVSTTIGRKYILDECVFDASHKAPDACIFVLNNGAIAYKCFHNSCQGYAWQDVRRKFEPDAYDRKYRDFQSQRTTKPTGTTIKDLVGRAQTPTAAVPFVQLSEIEPIDRSTVVSIPSGFRELDRKLVGFNKGEITLWSGKNGSGKSSVLNQICLNACQDGFKCAIFSGELTKQRMKQWIEQQAAGRQNVQPSRYEGLYYVPRPTGEKIDKWLDGKLWVYDNAFGNKFEDVLEHLKVMCEKHNIDVIVLDNLMALDLLTLVGDKWQQQTTMVLALTDFVKTYGVHLHIVCHPRKAVWFLRKDDISGTADLTNAVDNVLIIHRVGQDFFRLGKEFYGEQKINEFSGYSNVVEVCKNRDLGIMDHLVGLYYEPESKRFLNEKLENVVYGWEDSPMSVFHEDFFTDEEFGELPFGEEVGDLPY